VSAPVRLSRPEKAGRTAEGAPAPDWERIQALLQLESQARSASSPEALCFHIANETRKLLPYRQAYVFACTARTRMRMRTAAGTSSVDPNAPLVAWAERVVDEVCEGEPGEDVRRVSAADLPARLRDDWAEHSSRHVLWCSLRRGERPVGGLWLGRDEPWSDADVTLLRRLADAYGHAWAALLPRRPFSWTALLSHSRVAAAALALLLVLSFPVRLTTLAPVEVVARDPVVVSAPIEGVVREILVPPNTRVEVGTPLVAFEDTLLRNRAIVAERTLSVAIAEMRTANQGAFHSAESGSQVALLRAKAELAQAELDYAREELERVVVRAARDGLVLYRDPSDWAGRPVAVGERILLLADPELVELRIDLPVDDAMVLQPDAPVRVFLDSDPLHTLDGVLTHASYEAAPTADQQLAYRVRAELIDEADVRIGLKGTAKIYGERVSLAFTLLRRPIGAARQWLGW